MSIDKSIRGAIENGKSAGFTRILNNPLPVQGELVDSTPMEDKISELEKRKARIEEITQIETSIINMDNTIRNQKKVADAMLAVALGGILNDINGDQYEASVSFDMESMNLASLSQSRLYQNQRDFHERVLLYNSHIEKSKISGEVDAPDAMSLDVIKANIDDHIKKATQQLSSAKVVEEEEDETEEDQ